MKFEFIAEMLKSNLFQYLNQGLKYFLLENGCRGVFIEVENDENNHQLSDESVQFLIQQLMKFIDLRYSMYKWNEIEKVCDAAVFLFPCIEKVNKLIKEV